MDSETVADKLASGEHVNDPRAEKGVSIEGAEPRAKWAHKMEFFSCASTQIISLNTLWVFPFLFFNYGGGIFLIPYCLSLFFCGMPLYFLGLAIGQYTGQSGVTAWKKICPMFQGIGIASMVLLTYMSINHAILPVWSLFYLYNSFKNPMPWATCDNMWNTALCISKTNTVSSNTSANQLFDLNSTNYGLAQSAEMEFWRSINPILDFESTGGSSLMVQWKMIPCLLIVWVLSYFCTWKGIKYTGKIMYTVTFPYLLLIVFFIRGVTLPGAVEGLKYLFVPDFRVLLKPRIWMFSVSQSLYFAIGTRTTLGSYNKYNNNCYSDCLILCVMQVGIPIFLSCIVFSFLGFTAHVEEVAVYDLLHGGLDLLFGIFPQALSHVSGSSTWTVLFFLMSTLLSLSHQFVLVECLATNVSDLLPRYLRKLLARELLVLVICGLCLLLGLLLFTEGGLILFSLNSFGLSDLCIFFIVCFETIVIAWVYGADRFYNNLADMMGYVPFPVLKYCWLFITPLITGIMLLLYQENLHPIFFHNAWRKLLGFILIATPLMCIPVFMLIALSRNVRKVTTPSGDLRQIRPHRPALSICKRVICAGRPQPDNSDDNEAIMM